MWTLRVPDKNNTGRAFLFVKWGAAKEERGYHNMSQVPFFRAEEIYARAWKISYAFVAGGVPVYSYLVEGRDFALLIDTMLGYGNLRAFCGTLTDKPVKLVNTHFHFDHCGGNYDFDACYLHPLDIPYFYSPEPSTGKQVLERARREALPEYRDKLELSDFTPERPMRVYPVYDGDLFDLGDRKIEIIYVGGHSPGSIVLLDRVNHALFSGDACNGNTLLGFGVSLSVEEYLGNLLHLKRFQQEFTILYGGHQILSPAVLDEGIELCGRVIAGTDDHDIRTGMFGKPAVYAARAGEGTLRADGKSFNMCYNPDKVLKPEKQPQVITMEPVSGM